MQREKECGGLLLKKQKMDLLQFFGNMVRLAAIGIGMVVKVIVI